jgi:hypothetical protein
MRLKSLIGIFFVATASQACFPVITKTQKAPRPSSQYQQVDFQSLVKRYLKKDKFDAIEGIYSVSGTVTKKGKAFLSTNEKEKVTDRKENYAQVAIVRDLEEGQREYMELSLDAEMKPSYSVVGEFSLATNGNIMIYKHLAGKNSSNYTFTTDKSADILEGIRTENDGNTIITYKLTYVKLFPK